MSKKKQRLYEPEFKAKKKESDRPDFSVKEQCELLNLNRSSYYYQPKVRI